MTIALAIVGIVIGIVAIVLHYVDKVKCNPYDDTTIKNGLASLLTQVKGIVVPKAYDDTQVKSDIASVKASAQANMKSIMDNQADIKKINTTLSGIKVSNIPDQLVNSNSDPTFDDVHFKTSGGSLISIVGMANILVAHGWAK